MPPKAKQEDGVAEAIEFGVTKNGGWRPEPGDRLKGIVVDVTTGGHGSEYGRYPIVVLSTKDGDDVAVHAFHHTLKTRLVEMRVKVGQELDITYHGAEDQTDKEGKPRLSPSGDVMTLERYTVDSPQFEFNWDQF